MRKVIIRDSDSLMVSAVALPADWTGAEDEWQVPAGHSLVDDEAGEAGDTWDGTKFIPAPEVLPPTDAELAEIEIAKSKAWLGLIRVLTDPTFAAQGKTDQQVIDAIKGKLP